MFKLLSRVPTLFGVPKFLLALARYLVVNGFKWLRAAVIPSGLRLPERHCSTRGECVGEIRKPPSCPDRRRGRQLITPHIPLAHYRAAWTDGGLTLRLLTVVWDSSGIWETNYNIWDINDYTIRSF